MRPTRGQFIFVIATGLAACSGAGASMSTPDPIPVDVSAGDRLSAELAQVRLFWGDNDGDGVGDYVRLGDASTEPVPVPSSAVFVAASPTGRYFAYATGLTPGADIELVDGEEGIPRTLVRGAERFPGASFGPLSFSPDETSIIFEVMAPGRIDLAIVEVQTGKVQFLDLGGGINRDPRISPDGKYVLVMCDSDRGLGFTLCLLDRAERTRTYLVDDFVLAGGYFTPAGQHVVYLGVSGGLVGEGSLYRVGLGGQDKTRLASSLYAGTGVLAVTSSDVVFTCRFPDEPACTWICTIGLDGSNPQRIAYLDKSCPESN